MPCKLLSFSAMNGIRVGKSDPVRFSDPNCLVVFSGSNSILVTTGAKGLGLLGTNPPQN